MSRKTVAFPVPPSKLPARGRRSAERSSSDAWVARAAPQPEQSVPAPRSSGLMLDLGADRTFIEVVALTVLVPLALGWFWLAHAVGRRLRREPPPA